MNILDVNEVVDVPAGQELIAIFNTQRRLMEKYHLIEKANGIVVPDNPVDIDSIEGQVRIKDFAWRVTEEICEAAEAAEEGDLIKFNEEIADAMHFLVELYIIIGMEEEVCTFPLSQLIPNGRNHGTLIINNIVIVTLGIAMNCLKNKPWKQTHVATDIPKFKNTMLKVLEYFCWYFKSSELNATEVYSLYHKKSKVNEFRISTNY